MRESKEAKKSGAKKVGAARPRLAGRESREWRVGARNLKRSAAGAAAKQAVRRDAARYCTLQTRSVPGVVPQSVPMGVALVIDNQVFD
jgi:hypothetical protein